MSKYISDKSVAERYEIGRSTVWHWVSTGRLPKPHKITSQTTRWKTIELDAFDEQNHGGPADGRT